VRIVADTNVLVSALIFPGGSPEAVYRLALEGRIEPVTSRPLLTELGRVLTEKFGWQSDRVEEALAQLIRVAEIVEPRQRVVAIQADPADDRVLDAAAEGNVDAIVSGDRHLLELGSWQGIAIESPAAFLELR
jgi:putative PIN family toxin of toxin-antitoxin system